MSRRLWRPLATLVLVVAGGALGFWLALQLSLGLSLSHQQGRLMLPQALHVKVRPTDDVDIGLHGLIAAEVPLKQTLEVPLKGTYRTEVVSRASIPLNFVIHYEGRIPVHASADIEGTTDLVFNSRLLPQFPIRARLPLDFEVPVSLRVPVSTRLDVNYDGPIQVTFDQVVSAPVDTVLKTRFPVDRESRTPIRASFRMAVVPPPTPVDIGITQADLRLPLTGMRLTPAQ